MIGNQRVSARVIGVEGKPARCHRRAVLVAAAAFMRIPPDAQELRLLHAWLDSWRGIGAIAVRMARQR
jgi:hypothetical protein